MMLMELIWLRKRSLFIFLHPLPTRLHYNYCLALSLPLSFLGKRGGGVAGAHWARVKGGWQGITGQEWGEGWQGITGQEWGEGWQGWWDLGKHCGIGKDWWDVGKHCRIYNG